MRAVRDVKDRLPVPPDSWIGTAVHVFTDRLVQPLPFGLVHCNVAREGVEKRDVLVGRVERLPEVARYLDVVEETARLDVGRLVEDLLG